MKTLKRVAKEMGVSYEDAVKLRDTRLTKMEWELDKFKRVLVGEAAEEKLKLAAEVPLAVPVVLRAQVKKECPNPRYVEVVLQGDPPKKVFCAIPRKLYGRLIGKIITVHAITDAQGNTGYRHEAC